MYWFEPLAAVSYEWGWEVDVIPQRNLYHYDNGTEKLITDEMRSTLLDTLRHIFECNITQLDSRVLRHRFITTKNRMHLSKSMLSYKYCMDIEDWVEFKRSNICQPILTDVCQRSKLIAVKVIRLDMRLVEDLLKTDPNVRIIHLVRDPRGLLTSWWRVTRLPNNDTARHEYKMRDAYLLCKRISSDVHALKELEAKYPGRLLMIRYEDLATNIEAIVNSVYVKLLGLPIPDGLIDIMKTIGNATADNDAYGIVRKNSTATAFQWRQIMEKEILTNVNIICSSLINELQYDSV
jgi:chondroitin 6-sulfotransferase 3/keratan sulfate 6-sulfotransferase 1